MHTHTAPRPVSSLTFKTHSPSSTKHRLPSTHTFFHIPSQSRQTCMLARYAPSPSSYQKHTQIPKVFRFTHPPCSHTNIYPLLHSLQHNHVNIHTKISQYTHHSLLHKKTFTCAPHTRRTKHFGLHTLINQYPQTHTLTSTFLHTHLKPYIHTHTHTEIQIQMPTHTHTHTTA